MQEVDATRLVKGLDHGFKNPVVSRIEHGVNLVLSFDRYISSVTLGFRNLE